MSERSGYERSAHLYDLFDAKSNIAFFGRYAREAGVVLDVGAGRGRIAIPLARMGVTVYAVEPSPAMRGEFERKLRQGHCLPERITLVAGDAQSFELERTFPLAMLSGSFDHLLDDGERLAALRNIGRHLTPGGLLVFDLFLGLMEDRPLSPAGVARAGDREIRRFVGGQVLPEQRVETRLIFEVYREHTSIERIEERSLVGTTSCGAIHRLLRLAGFVVHKEWGSYDWKPFEEGDALLIVEAVKVQRP
jgi:SAM-dependent methyltransferase